MTVDSKIGAVSAGARTALQWERTQPWSCIAYINLAAASAINGASIIFTTCNQGQGSGNLYRGYEFWLENIAGAMKLRVRIISNYGGNNYIGVTGSTTIQLGRRYKVAATYDGSGTAAGVKLYVDGVLETNTVESDTLSATIIDKQPLWIGNQRGWPYSLGGTLEQFSLSNAVRNIATIQAYTTAAAAVDANTVLAYNFSEGTGKITADLSANGFTGAMNAARWGNGAIGTAPYWVQGKLGPDLGLVSAPSSALTLAAPVTSGNALLVTACLAGTGTVTISDDKGNIYTPVANNTTLGGTVTATFYCANITNAPTVITATLGAGNATYWRVLVDEVANIKTASPLDGKADLYTAAANGADAASSGNFSATPAVNYDFIYGVATNFSATAITPGTGFTSLTLGTSADNEPLYSEYLFQPVAAAVAAKWTTGGATSMVVAGMALQSV